MKKLRENYSEWIMPVFVLVGTFVFAMFQGGFVSWFIFYSFMPFIIIPFLLRFSSLNDLKVTRRIKNKEYLFGEQIEVEITITREGFMPLLYIMVEDQVPERLQVQLDNQHKCIRFPFWRKKIAFSYCIPAAVRGEHDFNGVKLTTGDFLGFYKKVEEVKCFSRLLVYPQYEKVAFKNFEALYEQGQRHLSMRNFNESTNITSVRPYISGDRMSWIHWKATAKKNEIMTKEFEESKNQDIVILLDQTPSPLFEDLVSLAASLAYVFLQRNLGVACIGTAQKNAPLIIGRGEQQRQRIFYELAKVEANSTQSLEAYLESKQELPSQAAFMIVTCNKPHHLLHAWNTKMGKASVVAVVMQEQEMSYFYDNKDTSFGIQCTYVTPSSWKSSSGEVRSL